MTGHYYLGPVRDYAHAGLLQARFEGDGNRQDDMFADTLDASVRVFCQRELAHYFGDDTIGDAGTDALFDAFTEDGVSIDSHGAAESWLEDNYSRPVDWLAAVTSAADRVTKRKARDDAKRAVIRFVGGLFA